MLKVKEEEKRLELENLNALKDEEIRNLKSVWQAKTNELLDEVFFSKNFRFGLYMSNMLSFYKL